MVDCRFTLIFTALYALFILLSATNTETNVYGRIQRRTWDQAIAMAKDFVAALTLEEKCNMTEIVPGPCHHNVLPVTRLKFGGLCLQDGGNGVANAALHSTAFPTGIHIAASWDRALFYQRAVAIGKEFQGKGIHTAIGPMINMDRNARHGRNWEGFGSDPYLAGENAFAFVQGVQDQGVVATAKHYICNEQETNRMYDGSDGMRQVGRNATKGYSVSLDDKTMHEIYLWPFTSSVAAGVGSIMCSYNQVNGTPACQNNKTLNGLLKGELQFQGNVISDSGATKAGVESVLGGLDLDSPGNDGLLGYALIAAVRNGSITETRVDDMVTRIMAPYYLLGQDQAYPSVDLDRDTTGDNDEINRQLARAGMILLKNTNNILPFNVSKDTSFYIYGAAAGQTDEDFRTRGLPEHGGALYQGEGSGYIQPAYAKDPLSAMMSKGQQSHLQIRYISNQNDYDAINDSFRERGFHDSKCLVFISAWSAEGSDRKDLYATNNGDQLVQTVASHCVNTIVIVNSVAQLNLERWIDLPSVVGTVWTGMPGAEYGPALVDVLFGDYNPGGKLVFTIAKNDSDYGTDITLTYNSNYTEGVFLDYRHFDRYGIVPRYSFGYGLSYTTFSFAELNIFRSNYRKRLNSEFGNSKLYDPVYNITFTVTNTGRVNGSEVPQLYLGFPAEAQEPPKVLRGFERVYLSRGESKQVNLVLTQKDISYWNVVHQQWTVAPGTYTVWISTSANNADIKLQGSFHE